MKALLYQRFRHILGEVARFCITLLQGTSPVNTVNHTHIVLIFKIKNPHNMSHFRPISLCNVVYKITLKALANRFQEVPPRCIDEA